MASDSFYGNGVAMLNGDGVAMLNRSPMGIEGCAVLGA